MVFECEHVCVCVCVHWVFYGFRSVFMQTHICSFVRSLVGSIVVCSSESREWIFSIPLLDLHTCSAYIYIECVPRTYQNRFTHVEFMPIQLTVKKIELTTFTHFYLRITHKIPFIYVWYTLGWNIMVSPIFYNFKRDAPRSTKCIPLLLYIKCLLILSGRKSF